MGALRTKLAPPHPDSIGRHRNPLPFDQCADTVCDRAVATKAFREPTNGGSGGRAFVLRAAIDRGGYRDIERDIAEGAENVRHHFDRD